MSESMWQKVYQSSKKHKEWSMVLSDYLARPVAVLLAYTPITPNQISILSFLIGVAGAYFLYLGGPRNLIIGASLAMVYNILDMCDGMIARVKNLKSATGHWLDGVLGFILFPIIILGLTLGLKNYLAFVLGMLAIVSYPLQYNLVYFYKLEVMKSKEQIAVPGKLEWIRYAYGSSFFYVFLFIAALFNKPLWVLAFWASLGNLYWIGLLYTQYRSIK
jgi:phosphatidylglycerophosphate synthase